MFGTGALYPINVCFDGNKGKPAPTPNNPNPWFPTISPCNCNICLPTVQTNQLWHSCGVTTPWISAQTQPQSITLSVAMVQIRADQVTADGQSQAQILGYWDHLPGDQQSTFSARSGFLDFTLLLVLTCCCAHPVHTPSSWPSPHLQWLSLGAHSYLCRSDLCCWPPSWASAFHSSLKEWDHWSTSIFHPLTQCEFIKLVKLSTTFQSFVRYMVLLDIGVLNTFPELHTSWGNTRIRFKQFFHSLADMGMTPKIRSTYDPRRSSLEMHWQIP